MEQQKAPSQQRNHWPKYDKTLGIQKGTRAPEQQQQAHNRGWGPARHTELTGSRLRSGTPLWTHTIAVEVRHDPPHWTHTIAGWRPAQERDEESGEEKDEEEEKDKEDKLT